MAEQKICRECNSSNGWHKVECGQGRGPELSTPPVVTPPKQEYTPTEAEFRTAYIVTHADRLDVESVQQATAAFNRGIDQVRAEERAKRPGRDQILEPFVKMVEEMREAVAHDVLTTPHGEAEYPVSHLADKVQECIDASLALEPEVREVTDAWHGDPDNVQLYNRDGSKRPWDEVLAEIAEKRKALDASEAAAAVTDG